jgi:hypothetical protein
MVTVNYIGRFGNNLFQYVFARLLATKNGLKLVTEWNRPDMLQFTPNPDGRICTQMVRLDDQHGAYKTNLNWLRDDFKNVHVELKGYFQHPTFYDDEKDLVKSWILFPALAEEHDKDVVMHLRLDDYEVTGRRPIIDQTWYADVLEKTTGRVFVVVEKPKAKWEDEYLNKLQGMIAHRAPEFILGTSAHNDFHFIRSFGTIISSNSSFSWWAAWLSKATKIYTFERWLLNSPLVKLQYAKGMTAVGGKYVWET